MSENTKTRYSGPRRRHEQRWALDVAICSESIDWDQPRTAQTLGPIGAGATLEMHWAKQQIRKFDDIAPAFITASERRERMAKEAEAAGHSVTREHYFAAVILPTGAGGRRVADRNL